MRIRFVTMMILPSAMLASCATTRVEKPVLTRAAVRAIVSACHAVSGAFHPDGAALPWASFVVRQADVRDNMGDMCFARKLSAYRYRMMSFRAQD
jgi:hypothetical protein